MAKNAGPGATMREARSYFVDLAAQLLDADEREAVLGDLHESGVKEGKALREILGLVARRQAVLWADWRPWFILLGVIAPLALLISLSARDAVGQSSVYLWLYGSNLDMDLLQNRGFWYELAHTTPFVLDIFVKLFCCSWTVGFAIGSLSARTPRLNRALLLFSLLLGISFGAPMYFDWWRRSWSRALHLPALPDVNSPVSASMFYGHLLPVILQLIFVVAPSLWGLRQGLVARDFHRALRVGVWTLCSVAFAEMLLHNLPVWLLSPQQIPAVMRYEALVRPPAFLLYWPVLFLLGTAVMRKVQLKRATRSSRAFGSA